MRELFQRYLIQGLGVGILLVLGLSLAPLQASAYVDNELTGDSVFLDAGAMSQGQIQAFLAGKGSYLANYSSPSGRDSNNNVLASQIIYEAAQDYGLNPQVILSTLQKEQGLVTDPAPSARQLSFAMGYGCPDGGSCGYPGFYNQVDNATWQFRFNYERATGNNNWWRVGQSYACKNSSRYYSTGLFPGANVTFYDDSATAIKTFVIANGPTASLYCYTPHPYNNPQGLYGKPTSGTTGQYYSGSYNYVYWFEAWFGSVVGDLVRTVNDASVYLISGQYKYPISDGSVLNDYSTLGPIRYVSDSSLNSKTTGGTLGHMAGSSGGTIYFVNAAIKLSFSSCTTVSDYGYSCGQVPYLTDGQLAKLSTGPSITSLYATTSGKKFYISNGQKREIFDQQSLDQAGVTGSFNTLLEAGVSYLPYGAPVIRNGVVATIRTTGKSYIYDTNRFLELNSEASALPYLNKLPHSSLDDASVPSTQRVGALPYFVQNEGASNQYLLTMIGKAKLVNPQSWTGSYIALSDTTLGAIDDSQEQINNGLVKSRLNSSVYLVQGAKKRPIPSWTDLVNMHISPFEINTLPETAINSVPTGPLAYSPGRLVKANDSSTVYVVKSLTELLPISSFLFPQELGLNLPLMTMSTSDAQTYTKSSLLQSRIVCRNGVKGVGINGLLYSLSDSQMTQYGFNSSDFVDVGDVCGNMQASTTTLGEFIRVSGGTIYQIQNGQKHAFTNYGAYVNHGGNSANTNSVSDYFASLISPGSNISQ